jgi:hypothetical protein
MCSAPSLGSNPFAGATPAEEYPIVRIVSQAQARSARESLLPSPVIRVLPIMRIKKLASENHDAQSYRSDLSINTL